MIRVTIEIDSLVEENLTHKKRSEFNNAKSVVDRLEDSINNLRKANKSLTDKITYLNEENLKLRKLKEGKEE